MSRLYTIRFKDSMSHSGTKGMKWGIRRWQNYDGSYTPAGRIHYGIGQGRESGDDEYGSTKSKAASPDTSNNYDHRVKNHAYAKKLALAGAKVAIGAVQGAMAAVTANPMLAISGGSLAASALAELHDVAVPSIKGHRVDKENSKGDIDDTTGFHKKTLEMSKDDDMARVNPRFNTFDPNVNNNCMLCTMTYDLRRRGFAVQANQAGFGFKLDDMSRYYKRLRMKDLSGPSEMTNFEHTEYVINSMKKQPKGSHGSIFVKFMNGGGHAMAYEVSDNGDLEIYDCQSNKKYVGDSIPKLLSRCRNDVKYARLDNLKVNTAHISEVAH